jgi:proton glutamate symport protein
MLKKNQMQVTKVLESPNSKLSLYILMSLVAGIIFGWLYPKAINFLPYSESLKIFTAEGMRVGAKLFLQMIKMIIAPLVFSTLVVGIAGHGNLSSLGKIGSKTIIYFITVTTIALIIGLLAANIFHPGQGCTVNCSDTQMKQVTEMQTLNKQHSIGDTIINVVPASIIEAMATNQILQIVVFSIFFSLAVGSLGVEGWPVLELMRSISEIMFKFTEIVMKFAPIGVFCAIASTVGENGLTILFYYAKLIFSLYFALGIFVVTVLATVCAVIKVPFLNLLKVIKEPALLAFSTATSEAALPKAMQTMEDFGVPKKIVGFVMPTGYTFNLDGSTLYLSLASIFIAQMYGINLDIWQQIALMFTLMLSSKGMAAVPRVSLIILAGTLGNFNIPVAGIGVLLGIDHILDMGRTTVNLIGNCVATVVIAKWENEFDYNKMENYIKGISLISSKGKPSSLSWISRAKRIVLRGKGVSESEYQKN